jgi:hypothetical protein
LFQSFSFPSIIGRNFMKYVLNNMWIEHLQRQSERRFIDSSKNDGGHC